MKKLPEIIVQNLDHLGLVAGIIDRIQIVEKINQLVGCQPGEIVSPGHAVKAMILNGLGLVSAPLYLFSKFFEGKPTEHLIGKGIKPEHLNDDRLGRVLDKLYVTGLSQSFTAIALEAAVKFDVCLNTVHLDSSSFHLHGEYKCDAVRGEGSLLALPINSSINEVSSINHQEAPLPIHITYGYSRDHRPDLKQFIIDLICSGDGDVPLFLKVADGNQADSAVFGQILSSFKQQLNLDSLFVADSALYTANNLEIIKNLKWLSRVPLGVKQAKNLISQLTEAEFVDSNVPGYRWSQQHSDYAGIPQKWLVVESAVRRQADLRRIEKEIQKLEQEARQKLRQLSLQKFACEPDALEAAIQLSSKFKYHKLINIHATSFTSVKKKSDKPGYKLQANIELDERAVAREIKQSGRFILATNVLDSDELDPDKMLSTYKQQQSAERGFSFLKDPLFFTDSVFLKSSERIESLALIMGLCLLVYTLAQRHLRSRLIQSQAKLKNQLGQLTERPTLRWIFQCFQAVHLLTISSVKQISNLTDERLEILRFFPNTCRSYYLLD
jgi:transposase